MKNFLKKNELIFLVAIVILAAFLRLYKLAEIPPGVNRDEASIAYTAYSLLKTGADEYDRSFPLSFQSFGDWKLPLYIYVTVPFVKFIGLNELAVRLPSAIAGILTVLVTYFLARTLFPASRLPLLISFLLAITPWHIHLSRVESESNLTVFLMAAAFLLFLKGLKRHGLIVISAILFSLTYFTYHGNHITSSLLFIGAVFFFRKEIPRNKTSLFALFIVLLSVGFVLSQTLVTADKTKLAGISIFGDPAVVHSKIEIPRTESANPDSIIVRLKYNRLTYAAQTIVSNYLKSFAPDFLFVRGGGNRAHNIEGIGNLLAVEAPFFYLGILILLFSLRKPTYHLSSASPAGRLITYHFLLLWLLISPIAASITKDAPHTNRMFSIFPLPPIMAAIGIFAVLNFLKRNTVKLSFVIIVTFLYLWNFSYYLNQYFVRFPNDEWQYWGSGYKQLTEFLTSPRQQGKNVIMSHPETSPYIYFLFYSMYDPKTYQTLARRYETTPDGFVHVKSFNQFEFRDIDWSRDTLKHQTVIVDFYDQAPENFRPRVKKLANFGIFETQ